MIKIIREMKLENLIFNKNNNIVDILFDDFDKYGRPFEPFIKIILILIRNFNN